MKKIINNCWLLIILLFSFCSDKKSEETNNEAIPPPPPSVVVGVGKVLPEKGLSLLSINSSNKVINVFKKNGDYVNKGDVLFEMEQTDESIQVDKAQANLQTAQLSTKIEESEIKKAELQLDKLWKTFQISKNLLVNKAETQEKVTQDSVAYQEQLLVLEQQRKELSIKRSQIQEQLLNVKDVKNKLQNQSYQALESGILTRFDVNIGQVLSPNEYFGELAPEGDWVIEGEVDELYASEIEIGQIVEIVLIGQSKILAMGEIVKVSPVLQNKSILYETVGEASDRRVRRFTVKINKREGEILINQKVECKIKLQ